MSDVTDSNSEEVLRTAQLAWFNLSQDGRSEIKAFGEQINEAQVAHLKRLFSAVAQLFSLYWDLENVRIEYDELKEAAQNALADFKNQKNISYYEGFRAAEFKSQIDRKLTAFVSAASIFRDRSRKITCNKKFEGLSAEDFDRKLKIFYDDSFYYRILYNLRNFANHQCSPISTLPLNARHGERGYIYELKLKLQLNDLLASEKVQKPVRQEIQDRQEKEIDIWLACESYLDNHRRLFRFLLAPSKSILTEVRNFVAQKRAEENASNTSFLVLFHGEGRVVDGTKHLRAKLQHFPEREVLTLSQFLEGSDGESSVPPS